MNPRVILYGTLGCHLCDEARELVLQSLSGSDYQLEEVDIAGDDALETRYGLRIPVLRHDEHELNWPFSQQDVAELLD